MGETQSKQGSKPVYNKAIDKFELDVCIQNIKYTAELQQGRRRGEANQKEKDLKAMIAKDKRNRDRVAEFEKARSIVNDNKIVRAYGYVQTYCGIVKDHEMDIQNSRGDPTKIRELVPYVESILWGCQKLNINVIQKFSTFLFNCFGSPVLGELSKGTFVIKELRDCFQTLNPTDRETKIFLVEFCQRNCIDIESLNEIGHKIQLDEKGELIIEPEGTEVTIVNGQTTTTVKVQNNAPQNIPGGNPYPDPKSGFPTQGGFPTQDGFPIQRGFPTQGGFPSQGGFPTQGGFTTQGGYPTQGGFQYPQQQQMGFAPTQGGFQQGGFPQQVGMFQGYGQPLSGQYPTQQPGQFLYSPTGQQDQFSNAESPKTFTATNPYPDFNNIALLTAKDKTTQQTVVVTDDKGNLSLDEFNLRMKNIKEGL